MNTPYTFLVIRPHFLRNKKKKQSRIKEQLVSFVFTCQSSGDDTATKHRLSWSALKFCKSPGGVRGWSLGVDEGRQKFLERTDSIEIEWLQQPASQQRQGDEWMLRLNFKMIINDCQRSTYKKEYSKSIHRGIERRNVDWNLASPRED